MASLVPLLSLLSTGLASPAVPTDKVAETPAPVAKPVAETSVLTGGGIAGGNNAGGAGLTLLLTHRLGLVELGLDCHGVALFSTMLGLGAVGGLHIGDDVSLRMLGSVGMHSYAGVGKKLLSSDPGVSGTVPYAGGRLLLGYSFGKRQGARHRGFVGMLASLDSDLSRQTKSVTYLQSGWLLGSSGEQTARHTVGQVTVGGFFVAGVDLDLTGY